MKTIITIMLVCCITIVSAQQDRAFEMTHYTTDNNTSTFINIRFILNGNYLSILDSDNSRYVISRYPVELIETGLKENGIYFEKFNLSSSSQEFLEMTKKYDTRGYYFFYDKKGGNIKSIVEVIIYSKDKILTKRYYP